MDRISDEQIVKNIFDHMTVKAFEANFDKLQKKYENIDIYCEFYKAYYIMDGKAKMVINNKEYSFKKGMLVILPSHVHAYYVKNSIDNLMRYWCSFDLSFANREIQFTNLLVEVENNDRLITIYKSLIENLKSDGIVAMLNRKICILQIWMIFFENHENNIVLASNNNNFYNKVDNYILNHLTEKICISDLAGYVYMEQSYFTRVFKKYFAETPNKYINNIKLDRCAKELALLTDDTIEQIAENYGFSDYRYFTRIFKKRYGETPGTYRKRNQKCPH